ncbi:hypothetical protein L873DRAFT_1216084 [Choiromyces venosus 120613-1]|uniref:Uncharacterized protein n=1 Tax=Choiromyces venosus 120613-1 TaxID=1336337 RepID=A0A3N4JE32_9PEZI|nr:hypothetical protein L873DRAFT_1216084 [Choiromyces venosus 120613-1]
MLLIIAVVTALSQERLRQTATRVETAVRKVTEPLIVPFLARQMKIPNVANVVNWVILAKNALSVALEAVVSATIVAKRAIVPRIALTSGFQNAVIAMNVDMLERIAPSPEISPASSVTTAEKWVISPRDVLTPPSLRTTGKPEFLFLPLRVLPARRLLVPGEAQLKTPHLPKLSADGLLALSPSAEAAVAGKLDSRTLEAFADEHAFYYPPMLLSKALLCSLLSGSNSFGGNTLRVIS